MKILGFVGTAKNTGKTTTALHMLELVFQAGIPTALTSSGYDGENSDHVTGLAKPRYFARQGMTIATAASRLELGTAKYDQIRPTGINTILGEIIIARVVEPGFVVLAGPNRAVDIQTLLEELEAAGSELTLLDGALNRMAGMVLAEGLILSTGAAFDERIESLVEHAAAMEALFHFPASDGSVFYHPKRVGYFPGGGTKVCLLESGSLMDEAALQKVAGWLDPQEHGTLSIPGVIHPEMFAKLLELHPRRLENKELVFTSALRLLAAGSPKAWLSGFMQLQNLGTRISFITPIPLHFITVNPFYPKHLQKSGEYVPGYVDKQELLQTARSRITTTLVLDILQPPHPDLLALCGLLPKKYGG